MILHLKRWLWIVRGFSLKAFGYSVSFWAHHDTAWPNSHFSVGFDLWRGAKRIADVRLGWNTRKSRLNYRLQTPWFFFPRVNWL